MRHAQMLPSMRQAVKSRLQRMVSTQSPDTTHSRTVGCNFRTEARDIHLVSGKGDGRFSSLALGSGLERNDSPREVWRRGSESTLYRRVCGPKMPTFMRQS